jgi:hydrogenase expression/formation protein HypE
MIDKLVYRKLGAHRSEILVGPGHGCDNAVIKIGNNQVLVATADPLSMIPALGARDSAWLSVNLLASDLTTCGFPPQFMMVNLSLPPNMNDKDFEEYWSAFHETCKKLGVAILGGHTGRYVGCNYTIIGGGVMMTLAPENQYLSNNMSKPGDLLVMTKGVAIAATGILARVFPETIKKAYGASFLERAQAYFSRFSVVEDALTAASTGLRENGVTSMHDVTEGGLLGALYELSEASVNGLEIDLANVIVTEEAKHVCDLFEIDPYTTLSEGTLIASVKPEKAEKVLKTLKAKKIQSTVIGRVTNAQKGRWIKRKGEREALKKPYSDPYWEAYWKAQQRGWK